MADPTSVIVVKGSDHTLRARALEGAIDEALGDDDRTLALQETLLPAQRGSSGEQGGAEARREALASALDGARTPPFGTSRRIVVVRTDDGFLAEEAGLIAGYLSDPEPTTTLVLEAPGRIPSDLAKALKAVAAREVAAGTGRDSGAQVLSEALDRAGLELDGGATRLLIERLGEAAGRIPSVVDVLVSTFGPGAVLSADDVAPYLGEEGGVPVFELSKAVDAGDVPAALAVLGRLTGPMGMHPLQILAVLHNHFRRILRLDDPTVRSEQDAVEALDGRVKPYPAKLAWQRAQRLGTDGVRRAFDLLERADLDLRGGTGAPDRAVVEVLVTQLSMLSRRSAGSRRARAR